MLPKPAPIALEPINGQKVAVLSLLIQLPCGDDDFTPHGQSGLAIGSSLVSIGGYSNKCPSVFHRGNLPCGESENRDDLLFSHADQEACVLQSRLREKIMWTETLTPTPKNNIAAVTRSPVRCVSTQPSVLVVMFFFVVVVSRNSKKIKY